MPSLKVAQNDFSGGVAGRFGQKAIKQNIYLEDSLNVVPDHAGMLRPAPGVKKTPLELLPTDKYMTFVFRGKTYHVVYDPIFKRKFKATANPPAVGVNKDNPLIPGYPLATRVNIGGIYRFSYGYDIAAILYDRGVLNKINYDHAYIISAYRPKTVPDSVLTPLLTAYLSSASTPEAVASAGEALRMAAEMEFTNAPGALNYRPYNRDLYVDHPGDYTPSENTLYNGTVFSASPDGLSNTNPGLILNRIRDSLWELHPDPKFDSFRWQRFTVYDDTFTPKNSVVVRPLYADGDTGEPELSPQTFNWDYEPVSQSGVVNPNYKTKAQARAEKWGVSPYEYKAAVGAKGVVFYNPEGKLPPLLWQGSDPDLSNVVADLRVVYHPNVFGLAAYPTYALESGGYGYFHNLAAGGSVPVSEVGSKVSAFLDSRVSYFAYFGADFKQREWYKAFIKFANDSDSPYFVPDTPEVEKFVGLLREREVPFESNFEHTLKAFFPDYLQSHLMRSFGGDKRNYPVFLKWRGPSGKKVNVYQVNPLAGDTQSEALTVFPKLPSGSYTGVKGFTHDTDFAPNRTSTVVATVADEVKARFVGTGFSPTGANVSLSFKDADYSPDVTVDIANVDTAVVPMRGVYQDDHHKAAAQGGNRIYLGFSKNLSSWVFGTSVLDVDKVKVTENNQGEYLFNYDGTPFGSMDFGLILAKSLSTGYKRARFPLLGRSYNISTAQGLEGLWLNYSERNAALFGGSDRFTLAFDDLNAKIVNAAPSSRQAGAQVLDNEYILALGGHSVYYKRQARDYQADRYLPMTDLLKTDYLKNDPIRSMFFDGAGWGVIECADRLFFTLIDNRRDNLGWFPLDFGGKNVAGRFSVSEGFLYSVDAENSVVKWNPQSNVKSTRPAWVRFIRPSTVQAQSGQLETAGEPAYTDSQVTGSFESVNEMQADGTKGPPVSPSRGDTFRVEATTGEAGIVVGVWLPGDGYLTGFETRMSL